MRLTWIALLDGSAHENDDADTPPEPPVVDPVSRPGDLWICGQHRVLWGDATVLTDVETALGGELADVCFRDPRYNVNYANGSNKKTVHKKRPILNERPRCGIRRAALRRLCQYPDRHPRGAFW